MFEIITGKPGDGKTHFVIKYRFLPALLSGRKIFTNIDFGDDELDSKGKIIQTSKERLLLALSRRFQKLISPSQINLQYEREWWHNALILNDLAGKTCIIPRGSNIILDEAQMIFSKGNARFHKQTFFDFLTYHRHLDLNIIFITQASSLMDERVSDCCNEFLDVKNMWFLSTFFSNHSKVYFRQSNKKWCEPHRTSSFSFDKSIFAIYRSGFQKNVRDKRFVPFFMIFPIFAIILLIGYISTKGKKAYFFSHETHNYSPIVPKSSIMPLPSISPSTPTVTTLDDYKDALAPIGEATQSVIGQLAVKGINIDLSNPSSADKDVVYHGGLGHKLNGRWVLGKDGVSTWIYN